MRTPQSQAQERDRKARNSRIWKAEQRARDAEKGILPVSVKAYRDDREKVRKYAAQLLKQRGLG